jgi:hypothetical protein
MRTFCETSGEGIVLVDLNIDRRMLSELILEQSIVLMWTEFNWLREGGHGGFL